MDISCQKKFTKWYYCAAEGCTSDDRKRSKYPYMQNVFFHPFPTKKKDPKMREKWLKLLRRTDYEPVGKQRVCSLHFVDGKPTKSHPYPELFAYNNFRNLTTQYGTNITSGTRSSGTLNKLNKSRIKKPETSSSHQQATCNEGIIRTEQQFRIPFSLLEHFNDHQCQQGSDVIDRIDKLQDMTVMTSVIIPPPVVMEVDVETSFQEDDYFISKDTSVTSDHNMYSVDTAKEMLEYMDQSCQTLLSGEDIDKLENELKKFEESKEEVFRDTFVNMITKNDNSVKKYTGVPSEAQLRGLFDVLDESEPNLKYWSGKSSAEEVNYHTQNRKKTGPKRKLTKFHEFVLTLVKLRLAILSFMLSDIFSISESRVSQIFTTWINLMHTILTPCLKWPSRQKIRKHMPISFRKHFPNTSSIIDCTEIFIQKPRSPTAQSKTYSSYKSHNTFKILVSITPSGAFSFISDLWGGNTSDRYITEHSGYLDLIHSGDEVMADRGFTIRDLLTDRRATLVIPPFTRKCKWGKGKRLTTAEVLRTKSIAKHRIHVERAIGRLKTFRMLAQVMDLKYKPLSNQMVKVSGFICNLHKPLVTK